MDGNELRALRTGLKMTQSELASELGITQGYLGELERNEKIVDPRTVMAAGYIDEARAIKARVQSIFGEIVPEAKCEMWDYTFRLKCGTLLPGREEVTEVHMLRSQAKDEGFVRAKAMQLKKMLHGDA